MDYASVTQKLAGIIVARSGYFGLYPNYSFSDDIKLPDMRT